MPAHSELFSLNATGGEAFKRLSRQLKEAGRKDLRLAMNRKFRAAAKPVVADVRRAYLALPDVSPAARTGLQARITVSKAVRLEIRTGARAAVRVLVDSRRLPADMRALPWAWERGRWRHPVWPRPDQTRAQWHWVAQEVRPPFRAAVRRHDPEFRAAVLAAMEDTARELRG